MARPGSCVFVCALVLALAAQTGSGPPNLARTATASASEQQSGGG